MHKFWSFNSQEYW